MTGESLVYTDDGGARSDSYVDPADKKQKAEQMVNNLVEAQRRGVASPEATVALKHIMPEHGRPKTEASIEPLDTLTSSL